MDDAPKPVSLNYESPAGPDSALRSDRFEGVIWRIAVYTLLFGGIIVAFLPTPGRRITTTRNPSCGHNIHQLIVFAHDYAQRNSGSFPPTLQAVQPPSSKLRPSDFSKLLVCRATGLPHIYVGSGINLNTAPPDTILIYEQPGGHKDSKGNKGMINVGYKDGSVRLVAQPQADKIIAELKFGHNPPRPEKIQ
jgi:hypothetical protein